MILENLETMSVLLRETRESSFYPEWKLLMWHVNRMDKSERIGRTAIQDEQGLDLGHHNGG